MNYVRQQKAGEDLGGARVAKEDVIEYEINDDTESL